MNRAVVKALAILEHLLDYKDGRTLVQLAEDLDWPVSSVSDIVKTLANLGYIRRDSQTRSYILSLKLLDLGQIYLQRMELYRVSVPLLGQVSKKFETVAAVYLFDPGMRKLLLIAEEGGAPHLRFGWQLHGPVLHCSAPGKVVLSSLSDAEATKILETVGMPQLTPYTITNVPDLLKDLAEVRRRGYALDRQEAFLDIGCIAIPILIRNAPIGALTIRMLIERLRPEFIRRSLEDLQSTAAAISNGIARSDYRPDRGTESTLAGTLRRSPRAGLRSAS
jgi:IclR family transcriptional regulator, KDG regulon repressor